MPDLIKILDLLRICTPKRGIFMLMFSAMIAFGENGDFRANFKKNDDRYGLFCTTSWLIVGTQICRCDDDDDTLTRTDQRGNLLDVILLIEAAIECSEDRQ